MALFVAWLFWMRFTRLLAAFSEPVLPLLTIFAALIVAVADHACTQNPIAMTPVTVAFWVAIAVFIVQVIAGYNRRTHDPTWVLRYQDTWDGRIGQERRKAAGHALEDTLGAPRRHRHAW